MSRIGKKVIAIPEKTEVSITYGIFTVKGPLGTLTKKFKPEIEITIGANEKSSEVRLVPKRITLENKALWGTYASHIMNMISGVTTPYIKKLIIEGIGYKSEVKGDKLVLALGFSHPVIVPIPATLKVTAEKNIITVTGIDKEEVGGFVANIRSLKVPEPYKGKGIRYEGEVIKRKQGKKTA
ncbi:MAG: 50S ribosomal protein L6 [Parcubacteria group bacterium GW2011_GWF2_39_8b]|uniref:50S ribosomal protein L6 n=2 Tax=Candidatus Zambryskiibacteriota TaxID=1817925 RepID=A0A1G2T5U1_9BACT|nr:MAG: 50S ribosomal protein L6 [Parcubacteria group bacterium GW2011_GWF2_39_8b]KKR46209.1 MAG: 50S ribosomal protein L6 [Parcubacteria group bacterium GW2011_GWA2_40_14]OHA92666.1 MAG: 50S ribosomal protein L6 [Candidatus Zambryskibacteria bacterium RIFCSPHIGHO2_02_38_10.5]OHA97265.1 MAG: 50S ribosomal protein L6 [Candidatus Zambryskibacteria bacterium RIFCSPHIGHO2_12_FULL_38_37]OHA97394.1 MAG: 50S ribosomal protein L6 [Candidatus Zambryskibacteria bacterium RIFCSPHIGHO2_02_FULL_39_82]OHB08